MICCIDLAISNTVSNRRPTITPSLVSIRGHLGDQEVRELLAEYADEFRPVVAAAFEQNRLFLRLFRQDGLEHVPQPIKHLGGVYQEHGLQALRVVVAQDLVHEYAELGVAVG